MENLITVGLNAKQPENNVAQKDHPVYYLMQGTTTGVV